MCDEYQIPFLGRIPLDPMLMQAGEQGKMWSQLTEQSVGLTMFEEII